MRFKCDRLRKINSFIQNIRLTKFTSRFCIITYNTVTTIITSTKVNYGWKFYWFVKEEGLKFDLQLEKYILKAKKKISKRSINAMNRRIKTVCIFIRNAIKNVFSVYPTLAYNMMSQKKYANTHRSPRRGCNKYMKRREKIEIKIPHQK